ncbi:IS3 family transposase, partial [Bosea sp. (in: a-proteobacteria)]|uniref:IS3 family transposase n=1 Tax=Bosea sp. (in: a-proteobacteria) TaxID=1871050 RepID=UPI0039C89056
WRGRPASARATADLDLTRKIRTIHAASRTTYGGPRIHAELKAEGVAIGKKRAARLMGGRARRRQQAARDHDNEARARASAGERSGPGEVRCFARPFGSLSRSRTNCGWRISPACPRSARVRASQPQPLSTPPG